MKQQITILGSTGTIGQNTLDVIAQHPKRYGVFALTAQHNYQSLAEQCIQFEPKYAVLVDDTHALLLQQILESNELETTVLTGTDALNEVASAAEVDAVMAAIVGAAGLLPCLAAAKAGKRILLANKEALVMSGALFMQTAKDHGATILPIDSEHNAIFQCFDNKCASLLAEPARGIDKIILTASGGPFRTWSLAQMQSATPAQACNHPNWKMGQKISVDSATMANKGLEVIEAHWLFGAAPAKIDVLLHPQSIVHSMVQYCDGSVIAQLGQPDMRTPIAYGLAYPERISAGVAALDLTQMSDLSFEKPDTDKFPCLKLAYQALLAGGTAATVFNAANEVAVAAFLQQRIGFTDIANIIETTLSGTSHRPVDSIEAILDVDAAARLMANEMLVRLTGALA